jgi:hypothetical protein
MLVTSKCLGISKIAVREARALDSRIRGLFCQTVAIEIAAAPGSGTSLLVINREMNRHSGLNDL